MPLRASLAALLLLVGSGSAAAQRPPPPPPPEECEASTAEAALDVAGVRATLYNTGGLFWRGSATTYEVPKGSDIDAIFSAGLWIGGMADGDRAAGTHHAALATGALAAGVYVVVLDADGRRATHAITVAR